ncbi:hypothetical protein CEXT_417311 [Caerostris extrusa]|uniref:Uncharacterized protein n=1 Tax=Caerostris extrusa TaxID=172846 RepID=A0AAV4MXG6_CAEEX|nr:hypothetical protein CEXT_417311 [Caerostris extrusa]
MLPKKKKKPSTMPVGVRARRRRAERALMSTNQTTTANATEKGIGQQKDVRKSQANIVMNICGYKEKGQERRVNNM